MVRDPARIPRILKRIQQEWELCPDWTLEQVLWSLCLQSTDDKVMPRDIFYVKDKVWEGQDE